MPIKNNKILKYNPGEKSLKGPFIIYADLECLLRKIDTFEQNNNTIALNILFVPYNTKQIRPGYISK